MELEFANERLITPRTPGNGRIISPQTRLLRRSPPPPILPKADWPLPGRKAGSRKAPRASVESQLEAREPISEKLLLLCYRRRDHIQPFGEHLDKIGELCRVRDRQLIGL